MEAAIAVEGLVKRYGGRAVVDGVTFSVVPGAIVALLGRNGAGKTTTVECIAGFRRPDAGTVRVLGADPARHRHRVAERMGVMLQDGGAYPAASPREMLRLYTRLYRDARGVEDLLDLAGLGAVADRRYRTLSGGEQQRVNLALALAGTPQVLLVDEPTAGMDVEGRRELWELLRRLRDGGAAVLLTTHYIEEAERLADTVAVIHHGRLVAQDSPAALIGAADEVLVTTRATFDPAALAGAVGAAVRPAGDGRFAVAAGPEAIPRITAWFAGHGLALDGVTTQRRTLEDAVVELTGEPAGAAA